MDTVTRDRRTPLAPRCPPYEALTRKVADLRARNRRLHHLLHRQSIALRDGPAAADAVAEVQRWLDAMRLP